MVNLGMGWLSIRGFTRRMPKITPNLVGQRFGRLTVLERDIAKPGKYWYWKCQCDCGNLVTVTSSNLTKNGGHTTSCGCVQRERASQSSKKHGRRGSVEYATWGRMIQRCTNTKLKDYNRYGGRGIRVFDAWMRSFEAFYAYLGPRPGPGYSIDRINNDGNYEPGNVRWATREEQVNNVRTNKPITHLGETLTIAEWSRKVGISAPTLYRRLAVYGWSINETLTTPVKGG